MSLTDNPKLTVINGHAYATSLEVAHHFNKSHDRVLKDIRNLISLVKIDESNGTIPTFSLPNFGESTHITERGKTYPAYQLTRDGFAILAMGFTGAEALRWKIRYIAAFNEMEAQLSQHRLRDGFVAHQGSLFPDLVRTLKSERPALTVTAALTLLAYLRLNIPTVSRASVITAIKRKRLEGFKDEAGWMIYEDSFNAWMQQRRQAA